MRQTHTSPVQTTGRVACVLPDVLFGSRTDGQSADGLGGKAPCALAPGMRALVMKGWRYFLPLPALSFLGFLMFLVPLSFRPMSSSLVFDQIVACVSPTRTASRDRSARSFALHPVAFPSPLGSG